MGSDVKNMAETVIEDVSKFSPVAQIGNLLSNAVNTVTSSRDDSPKARTVSTGLGGFPRYHEEFRLQL